MIARLASAGVTSIDCNCGGSTVSSAERLESLLLIPVPGSTALIVVTPWDKLLATPGAVVPVLTVATFGAELFQVTSRLMSLLVPFAYKPVAIKFCTSPKGMLTCNGVTTIDARAAGITVNVADWPVSLLLIPLVASKAEIEAVPTVKPMAMPMLVA
jgi:hypothetical protein